MSDEQPAPAERTVRMTASPLGEFYRVTIAYTAGGFTKLAHIFVRGVTPKAAAQAAKDYAVKYLNIETISATIEQAGLSDAVLLEASAS